ncbi:MAG: hypothetical protein ACK5MJ_07440 [Alphaproteobacteria bacterium]
METLKIDSPFEKDDFVRLQLIKWQIHWLRNRKQLVNYLILSITILGIGIVARTEEEPTNPFLFLGFGFFVATLLFVYFRIYSKKRYSKKIREIADRFDSQKMDCTYEFSDESVKYWDKEKHLEFKWSVFTSYSIYKDYLVLTLNNLLIESYIFEKRQSDIDDYNKILEFAKSKLQYKELK